MKDFIFKGALNGHGYVDRTWLKKELAGVFGDRFSDETGSRYLFSNEPLINSPCDWFRVRLIDNFDTSKLSKAFKEIPFPQVKAGESVTIKAWIALNDNVLRNKYPVALLNQVCRQKLIEIGKNGTLHAMTDVTVDAPDEIKITDAVSKGTKFHRVYGHISITGKVTDENAFLQLQRDGLGAAKAYGFGLVAH